MRVLIVKTSSMGDVLHTLPALTDAAQAIPGIRFDWVVEEGFAQIPSWHKSVERVIPVAIRRWRKAWFSAPIKAERQAFREAVQAVKYDAIIDAQGLVKSAALVTRLAHGVKHGMDWQTAREPLASCFTTAATISRNSSTRWSVPVSCSPKALATRNPRPRGITPLRAISCSTRLALPRPIWCFCTLPPATISTGRKPAGRSFSICWPTAASTLSCRGGPHEEARAKRLAEGREYVEVLPRMSLEQVAQVLAGARAVVSVDTGLSHLTAALDKPNFTLYGPTDPGLIGGYGKNQHIVRPENSASTGDIAASRIHLLLQNQGLL